MGSLLLAPAGVAQSTIPLAASHFWITSAISALFLSCISMCELPLMPMSGRLTRSTLPPAALMASRIRCRSSCRPPSADADRHSRRTASSLACSSASARSDVAGARRTRPRRCALILSGRCSATWKPKMPPWLCSQQYARANLVDQRHVGGDDRLVGREPARHRLLHVVVIRLDRKLRARHRLALGGIGIP